MLFWFNVRTVVNTLYFLFRHQMSQKLDTGTYAAAWRWSLPSFGSKTAGPACDGTIDVREIGVIPGVVSCTNLEIITTGKFIKEMNVWLNFAGSKLLKYFRCNYNNVKIRRRANQLDLLSLVLSSGILLSMEVFPVHIQPCKMLQCDICVLASSYNNSDLSEFKVTVLTGHLVMSSGQSWGETEAGSRQILQN